MGTIRVHELAKDMDLSSKDLLDKLQQLGLNMKNHMSTIPSGEVNRIKNMVLNLEKIKTANLEADKKLSAQAVPDQKTKQPGAASPPPVAGGTPPLTDRAATIGKTDQRRSAASQPQPRTEHKGVSPQKQSRPQDNRRIQPGPPVRQGQPVQAGQPNRAAQPNRTTQPNRAAQPNRAVPGKTAPLPKTHSDYTEAKDNYLVKAEKTLGEKAYDRGGISRTTSPKKRFDDKRSDPRKTGKYKGQRQYQHQKEHAPVVVKHVTLERTLTVQEFAHLINRKAADVIKKLLSLGVLATINQELDIDTLILLGQEFGTTVEVKTTKEDILLAEKPDNPEDLTERPPVVTIMGHVDHGKTSLLDIIRHTNVTSTEAGGITQHIGAYQVEVKGQKITFLDTPGHEAFTAMRARGTKVTDIAILVVAADDGVMPQTVEAVNHAQAAGVPIIVAINKIDKPEANPERIKQQLTEHGLVAEEWGGETVCVNVSAKTKEGLEQLLEMILLVAEVADLKANKDKKAKGSVVEAKLDKGRGPVATVLVQNGTLMVGDFMIVGTTQGRVRAMQDEKGRRLKKALPSTPVEIIGLSDVPQAGDVFQVVEDEKLAKQITSERTTQKREETINSRKRISLEDLFTQIKEGEIKDLNIIIKADVQGSIEALKQSLERLSNEEVRVNIIHQGVGAINETDIMLADASNAIIIGFNVRPDPNARKMGEQQEIDIRLYHIIYNAIEDVKAALSGLLKPEIREVVLGSAEVRAVFKVPKVGAVAGCYVSEGKIPRNAHVRVIRDGIVVHEGMIDSLKRFKDDVKEVASGYECGIGVERFNDIHEGDRLEAFTFEEIKRELT